jgi:iron complex outermembrane recepter protein
MAFTRTLLLGTTTIAGVAALALAAPSAAYAQDPAPPAETTAADTEVEELVVTGSRIRRNEFTSPAPITVITAEGATLEGLVNASEILQTSTIAAGSTQINNQFSGFVVNGGGGVNTISLRGLGDQRSLVVLNGRRLGPAGTQGAVGAVDLNVLPSAAVERYEIFKTGASSIYGSDAIAGVVNVLTRTSLDGGIVEVSGALPEESGGGEEFLISGAWGKVFDRGRFQVSAEYFEQKALKFGDREDLRCQQQYTFDPVTGERNDWIDIDSRLNKCFGSSGALSGYIPVYLFNGGFYGSRTYLSTEGPGYPAQFTADGRFIAGPSNPDPNLNGLLRFAPLNEREGENPLDDQADFISPVKRYTLYADGAYDLTGTAELYGEALFNRRESSQFAVQQMFPIVAAEAPCPVNPFNCAGATPFGEDNQFFAPQLLVRSPFIFEQEVDYYRGVVGIRGEFGAGLGLFSNWNYDAFVTASVSDGDYSLTGINADKLLSGIGGDFFFEGICTDNTQTNPGVPEGCRPLAFFSPEYVATGQFSPEDYNYLRLQEKGNTKYTQIIAEASITGDLFQLPAGGVGAAFGVNFRYDEIDDQPGTELVEQNFYNLATASETKGDDRVIEAFGEVEIPLLRGRSYAENLYVNLNGRVFDYESFGTDGVYSVGLNYQITPEYRLRGTYGTSFRAPGLYERFLGDQQGFLAQTSVDPCIRYAPGEGGGTSNPTIAANCAADGLPGDYGGAGSSVLLVTGGGENLEPETSKALTIGFIWTPTFADINLAVDYFEIEVEDQVSSNGAAVVGQCYASPNYPDDPFCDLFIRNRDPESIDFGQIEFIDASFRNIVSAKTRGIDVTLRYTREIGPGDLIIDARGTWTLEDTQELFEGFTDDFNNVIGEPAVVASMEFQYEVGDWTFQYSNDFVGRQSNYDYQFGTDISAPSNFTTPIGSAYRGKNHAEPTWYHSVGVEYAASKWELRAGINNLFDEPAPNVSPALLDRGNFTYGRVGTKAFATQYDYIGRTFFAGITRRF